jgi:paraquat-inducible protein B
VVALDWHADSEEAAIGEFAGYTELPTQAGGLQHIEQQVATVLNKLNNLPLEASLDRLEGTLSAATSALEGATRVLDREATQALPLELTATLVELREVLSGYSADAPLYTDLQGAAFGVKEALISFETLARTLDAKPNSVIFGRRAAADPEPKGAQ